MRLMNRYSCARTLVLLAALAILATLACTSKKSREVPPEPSIAPLPGAPVVDKRADAGPPPIDAAALPKVVCPTGGQVKVCGRSIKTDVTSLTCNENTAATIDLALLPCLTKLRNLTVTFHDQKPLDLTLLPLLPQLEKLSITYAYVELGPISALPNLEELWLWSNGIADLRGLDKLTALTSLYIYDNPIADLRPIAALTGMKYLSIDKTLVSDLAPLAGMAELTQLSLRETLVRDLSPIARSKVREPVVTGSLVRPDSGPMEPGRPLPAAGSGTGDSSGTSAYETALKQGRALGKDKRHAEAVEAFFAALRARPEDAVALSELSWSAFKAGDLATATSAAQRSIINGRQPRVQAASLYNLGRILEARGDKPGAALAYRLSLRLRPNKTVKKRLDRPELIAPKPMSGPYSSLDEYCEKYNDDMPEGDGSSCTLVTQHQGGKHESGDGAIASDQFDEPYRHIETMVHQLFLSGEDAWFVHIAIQTARGWYLSDPILDVYVYLATTHEDEDDVDPDYQPPAPDPLELQPPHVESMDLVAGRGDSDVVRVSTVPGRENYDRVQASDALCGIGKSGVPSCVYQTVPDRHVRRVEFP